MDLTNELIRFFIVGSATTIVDFLSYNGLIRCVEWAGRITANILSVSCAMVLSFALNRAWVFGESVAGAWPVPEYLTVTIVSAYGIQTAVIHFLSKGGSRIGGESGKMPLLQGLMIRRRCRSTIHWVPAILKSDLLTRNIIKAAAIGAGLIWNFCWYKWYVFA